VARNEKSFRFGKICAKCAYFWCLFDWRIIIVVLLINKRA